MHFAFNAEGAHIELAQLSQALSKLQKAARGKLETFGGLRKNGGSGRHITLRHIELRVRKLLGREGEFGRFFVDFMGKRG